MIRKPTRHMYPGAKAPAAGRPASARLDAGTGMLGVKTVNGRAPWCVGGFEGQPLRARLNQRDFDSQI
jgi:hypothetical protein